jgi:hypothetical protein
MFHSSTNEFLNHDLRCYYPCLRVKHKRKPIVMLVMVVDASSHFFFNHGRKLSVVHKICYKIEINVKLIMLPFS